MTAQTPFDDNLAFALSCGSLRYAFSRRSYAVSVTADAIRDRLSLFTVADLGKMRQDIEDALAGTSIYGDGGDEMDRQRWLGLVRSIRDEEGRRG